MLYDKPYNPDIRPLSLKHLDRLQALQPEYWVPIEGMFRFFFEQSFCFPYVLLRDGQVVGTANGIQNKKSAWLSHIIVAPAYQGQGLGRALTEFILHDMLRRNNRTVSLVATEMGRPVYAKIGFRTAGHYNFYHGESPAFQANDKFIRQAMHKDMKAICKLDKKMAGEDRSNMLKLHLKNGLVFERAYPRRIQGFYLPTLGEGLVVAANNHAGITLLKGHLAHAPDKIVVPAENVIVNEFLTSMGLQKFDTASRMIYGKTIKQKANMLFNRVGGWYG